MLRKIEGKRKRAQQTLRWLGSITDSMDMNLSKLWGIMGNREAWCAAIHGVSKSRIGLSHYTTKTRKQVKINISKTLSLPEYG